MAEDDLPDREVSRLLSVTADRVGRSTAPDPAGLVRRAGRRDRARHTGAVVAVLLAVLAVVVPVGLFAAGRDTASPPPADSAAPPPSPLGTAAALAAGHWEDLPPAPISPRTSPAYTWTGSQLLIWGGRAVSPERKPLFDGASYDPATRTWAVLPAGPLETVESVASAWTGSQWLILGRPSGGRTATQKLVSYDPTARTWTELTLPEGRTLLYATTASWTGRELVVVGLGSGNINAGRQTTGREVWAYDPVTATWRDLPDLPEPVGQGTRGREAGVVDGDVVVLSEWDSQADVVTSAGVSAWRLDPDKDTWTAVGGTDPEGLAEPVTTPGGLLLPGAPGVCPGNVSCARVGGESGRQLDDQAWAALPDSPVVDGRGVWTGSALVVADAQTRGKLPAELTYGSAAAYDPTDRTWTALPSAGGPGTDDGVVVWTGRELIVWGATACGPAQFCVKPTPLQTGRVLLPAPPTPPKTQPAAEGPVGDALNLDLWTEEDGDLVLHWLGGLCGPGSSGADARAEETATEVRVVVVPRPDVSSGGCDAIGIPMTSRVTLTAPVGTRRVVNVGPDPTRDVPSQADLDASTTQRNGAIEESETACAAAAATLGLKTFIAYGNDPDNPMTVGIVRAAVPDLPAVWTDLPGDTPAVQCYLRLPSPVEQAPGSTHVVSVVVAPGQPAYVYDRTHSDTGGFEHLGD